MNRLHDDPLDVLADADETAQAPCAEALLAATLALMTGFAEHCAAPAPVASHPALPRLLAAKAVSNLFFLAEHPALSAPLRSTLWRLRGHWQALEACISVSRASSFLPAAACAIPNFSNTATSSGFADSSGLSRSIAAAPLPAPQ